jgi:hypothetical protein
MLNQELKDRFYLKYNSFLKDIPSKNILQDFYISSEMFYKNSCYYYPNREEFNKILLILINYNFKKELFKKDAFFTFLENEHFGSVSINSLEKNLIHLIQMEIDIFMSSIYNSSFKKVDFYQKNNPFKSKKEFHFFIISKILENIEFNPYDGSFSTKNEVYLLEEYFDKVMLQLKEKFDLLEVEDLHREVIRLEILKDKYHLNFLDSSIKKIEKLIERLSPHSDNVKEKKEQFKLNISPQKLSKLFVLFFENNDIQINEEKLKRINQFISNCFQFDIKYSAITNTYKTVSKSIDFLNKKKFKPFIAVLLLFIKLEYIEEKNASKIKDILVSDLKELNAGYIGLSGNLRKVISQDLNQLSINKLIELANFKSFTEITSIVRC